MKQYLFIGILTAAITLALAWAVWQLSLRYKLYPGIRERDVHTTPTPRLGGVAMYLAIVAAFVVSWRHPFFAIIWSDPSRMLAILAATTLIVLVGVIDDLWDLDWMIKLGAQFLAAGIIAWFGELQIYSLPIGGMTGFSSGRQHHPDGARDRRRHERGQLHRRVDGLVAGVALIANAIFFAYTVLFVRDTGASTYFNLASFLAIVLVGACIGFLPLNWSPAKLFMGDSGALVLGLLMATSGIAITGQLDPALIGNNDQFGRSQLLGAFIPILLPMAVVVLPLLDFGLALVRRMRAGKSPFSPDRKHLHHRMLDMGHSDRSAVLIFYAWTAIAGLTFLVMYIATRQNWFGQYWVGVAFGVVGAAACLTVTLTPSRRRRPAVPVSSPEEAP